MFLIKNYDGKNYERFAMSEMGLAKLYLDNHPSFIPDKKFSCLGNWSYWSLDNKGVELQGLHRVQFNTELIGTEPLEELVEIIKPNYFLDSNGTKHPLDKLKEVYPPGRYN